MASLIEAGADVGKDIGDGRLPIDVAWEMDKWDMTSFSDYWDTEWLSDSSDTESCSDNWDMESCSDSWDKEERDLKFEKIALLLRKGARLDSPSPIDGMTLLQRAVKQADSGDTDKPITFLLRFATQKTVRPEYIDDLLAESIRGMKYQSSKALLSYGAKLRDGLDDVAVWAEKLLQRRRVENIFPHDPDDPRWNIDYIMAMLLDLGLDFEVQDRLFRTSLKNQEEKIVQLLLNRGITRRRPGSCNPDSWLHEAATWGHTGILRRLLRGEPNINSLDSEGDSALSRAIKEGHLYAALQLMDHGADAYWTADAEQIPRPIQYAITHARTEILNEILSNLNGILSEPYGRFRGKEAWIPAALKSAKENWDRFVLKSNSKGPAAVKLLEDLSDTLLRCRGHLPASVQEEFLDD
ncbi:hypothetical protein F4677DRAFT_401949 [Hypoxylon crocopeplum]|nr:hypothetical protein F4677DRAFT_401949 [Hypoxylon crocopeplum]